MTTTTDANKALVLAGIKGVFIDRDPTVLDHLFSDDYKQHNPQIPNGTGAIKALLGKLPADFKYELGLVVAEGDFVTIHGRYFGWGPKPVVAVDIFRVANDKIAEHWDVMQEEVPAAQARTATACSPPRRDKIGLAVGVRLHAGDMVIQRATRHGWRNKSQRPATIAFVLLAAGQ
jgi:predicted SnoaL-like aldol condensation-catalyzing enzyme